MSDALSPTWPTPPATPKDVITLYFRNWGLPLASAAADEILEHLKAHGWTVERKAAAQ